MPPKSTYIKSYNKRKPYRPAKPESVKPESVTIPDSNLQSDRTPYTVGELLTFLQGHASSSSLTSDLSGWDTSNVKSIDSMFDNRFGNSYQDNVAIGYSAGLSTTTCSSNIMIGQPEHLLGGSRYTKFNFTVTDANGTRVPNVRIMVRDIDQSLPPILNEETDGSGYLSSNVSTDLENVFVRARAVTVTDETEIHYKTFESTFKLDGEMNIDITLFHDMMY